MSAPFRTISRRLQLILAEAAHTFRGNQPPKGATDEAIECLQLESRLLMSASPAISVAMEAATDAAMTESAAPEAPQQTETTVDSTVRSSGTQTQGARELVVIDPAADGYQELLADLVSQSHRQFEILLLDSNDDGISQITEALQDQGNVSALHLISHGSAGELQLGTTTLNSRTLTEHSNNLAVWRDALVGDRDLLIYGCDLVSTDAGRSFAQSLAETVQADVAASTDLTGAASRGGDWTLEYHVGLVDTQIAVSTQAQDNWQGLLATVTVTQTNDAVNGDTSSISSLMDDDGGDGISLREAILAANADNIKDTIQLGAGVYTLSLGGAGEDLALTGDLDINEDLDISGAGVGITVIDASGLTGVDADRVLHLRNTATVSIDGVTITGGSAKDGAGIYVDSAVSLSLEKSEITDNHTSGGHGGGLFNKDGNVWMADVQVSGNSATSKGGGGIRNEGEMTLHRTTISGNSAKDGGGIVSRTVGSQLTMQNVTISGNTATEKGGAIETNRSVDIISSTIAYNRAANGGGINSTGANLTIQGTILANNTLLDGTTSQNLFGAATSLGYNIDSDGSASLNAIGDQSAVDPLLVSTLAFSDGLTETHALQVGSIAIDAGHVDYAAVTDQRGQLRGARPDIGAYESNPVTFASVDDFAVNTTKTGDQITLAQHRGSQRAIALAPTGNYVVVWSSTNQDGSGSGVYARLFDSTGTALSGEILVNQTTTNHQLWASVATDTLGNFVVTWTSANQDGTPQSIYARRFNAAGTALSGEFRVNSTATGGQKNSSIAMNADGSFIIVWDCNGPGDADGIHAQRYDAAGVPVGSEFRVNATTVGVQRDSAIAINAAGHFAVVWDDGGTVYGRTYDENGVDISGEFVVDASGTSNNADVAIDDAGNVIVVWNRISGTTGHDVYRRAFDFAGNAVASAEIVNTQVSGHQFDASIAMNAEGAYVIAWEGAGTVDANGVHLQRFDNAGTKTGSQTRVNTNAGGAQHMISVQLLDLDHIVTVWSGQGASDSSGVYARQLGSNNNASPSASAGGNYAINEGQNLTLNAGGSSDPDGDLLTYTWDLDNDGSYDDAAGRTPTVLWDSLPNAVQNNGTYTVRVHVDDGHGGIDIATATLTVSNVAPDITSSLIVDMDEGSTTVQTVTATDPADSVTFTITDGADQALFSLDSNSGVLTFRTTPDFEAPADADADNIYEVEVTAMDEDGATDRELISVIVRNQNDTAPIVAPEQSFTVPENTAVSTSIGTVSANDDDPGTTFDDWNIVSGNGDGIFSIDPSSGEISVVKPLSYAVANSHTLTVTVSDGTNTSTAETVTIDVTDVNNAPTLNTSTPFLPSTDEDSSTIFSVASFLADHVTDEDTPAVSGVAVVGIDGNGYWKYSINNGANWQSIGSVNTGQALLLRNTDLLRYTGDSIAGEVATLTYHAWDQTAATLGLEGTKVNLSGIGTGGTHPFSTASDVASIIVQNRADTPVVNNTVTLEDTQSVTGLQITPSPGDSGVTHYRISSINHGKLFLADGTTRVYNGDFVSASAGLTGLKFTPAANFHGTASFNIQASTTGDATDLSSATTAVVTVLSADDKPVVSDLHYVLTDIGTFRVDAPGVLQHATDADGDALSAVLVTAPAHGTLTFNTDGSFTWTPPTGFTGHSSFTFAASDGMFTSVPATVSFSVATASPPVAGVESDGNSSDTDGDSGDAPASENEPQTEGDSTASMEFTPDGNSGSTETGIHGIAARVQTETDRSAETGAALLHWQHEAHTSNVFSLGPSTSVSSFVAGQVENSGIAIDESLRLSSNNDRIGTSHLNVSGLTTAQLQTHVYAQFIQPDGVLSRQMDAFENNISEQLNFDHVTIGSVTAVGSGLAVGSVIWAVRGGLLLSGLLAQMPVWTMFDPMMVIDGVAGDEEEGDSIQDIVDGQQPLPVTPTAPKIENSNRTEDQLA